MQIIFFDRQEYFGISEFEISRVDSKCIRISQATAGDMAKAQILRRLM